jgi:hypothetical protein
LLRTENGYTGLRARCPGLWGSSSTKLMFLDGTNSP